jgi:hypothetical protein
METPARILAVLPPLWSAAFSEGQPAVAAAELAADPPAVVIHEIASFPGRFPWREPWSPEGAILVYNDGNGLHAFDAMRPSDQAIRLTDGDVVTVAWSPDGGWLVGNQRLDGQGHERLLVIPLSGAGEIEMLRARYQLGGVFWGSNGCLYYAWNGEFRRCPPPTAWCAENPPPLPITDQYLQAPPPTGQRYTYGFTAARFRADPDCEEFEHIPAPTGERISVMILDELPARGQLLLKALPAFETSYAWIGDAQGHVRATFPTEFTPLSGGRTHTGFSPCSVSADGVFAIGFTTVEDGHFVYEAKLQLAHIDAKWTQPIERAPDATEAYFAHEGLVLALHGLHDGLIHVGALEVRPRG